MPVGCEWLLLTNDSPNMHFLPFIRVMGGYNLDILKLIAGLKLILLAQSKTMCFVFV